jgi:hypothetical protein
MKRRPAKAAFQGIEYAGGDIDTTRVPRGEDTARLCTAPGCARPLPGRRRRFCCDLCRIRGQRAERVTETGEFGRAAIRMIRQMARRVGANDIAEFGAMFEVMDAAERAVVAAITDLRGGGFTYSELGDEIGWSRQRLTQWYERRTGGNETLRPELSSGGAS